MSINKSIVFFSILALCLSCFAQDYPVNFPLDQSVTHVSRRLNSITLGGVTINIGDNTKVYNEMLDQTFTVTAGQAVTPSFGFNGTWMNGYVYLDRERDGQFNTKEPGEDGTLTADNDLVSYSYYKGRNSYGNSLGNGNSIAMPAFKIPEDMEPGYYRMRFKVDWNDIEPGGSTVENNDIVKNGGAIVDVRLLVHNNDIKAIVTDVSKHGMIAFHTGAKLSGVKRPCNEDFPIIAYAEEGYKLTRLRVRHGIESADSIVHGLPQYVDNWFEANSFQYGLFSIPASCMENHVTLEGIFEPLEEGEKAEEKAWALTFYDEFNFSDGSQPVSSKWSRNPRASSTWSRFISDSKDVVYIQDGNLVCRAIPDPDRTQGSTDMITGAIQSRGKYAFQYGRAEARLKTIRHTGNFPAFWMMPENPVGGWPVCGEIDIFETIDNQNKAWHTVHSNWTYNLHKTNNPKSTYDESVSVSEWHVYGIEWDAQEIRWYVDGTQVFSYAKSNDTAILEQGQWPFDKEFYLILNQSVGNGSWAAKHDGDFTYETRFDWVRIYQMQPAKTIPTDIENTTITETKKNIIYDLSGRHVMKPTHGIYIKNGKKIIL